MEEKEVLKARGLFTTFGPNAGYVEELYDQYLEDPESVGESWRAYFAGVSKEINGNQQTDAARPRPQTAPAEPSEDGETFRQRQRALKEEVQKEVSEEDEVVPIRGPASKILENMEHSLTIPTATSQRSMPVKVLEENRKIVNQYLSVNDRGKVSFTHFIAWAILRALEDFPNLNSALTILNGDPQRVVRKKVNFGVAVDMERKDGSRSLIVPNIKGADRMNFVEFMEAYNDVISRVRQGSIQPSDFQGTSITLTNPGTVGTVASLPRLMVGQGAIVATGAIQYPAEYHGMSTDAISTLGISKVMNVTCTYDHRIIQGAESGMFLGRIHDLLLGKDGFYEQIFEDLRVPQKPFNWSLDFNPALFGTTQKREEIEKQARVLQLINLYRVRGHLIANLDPLGDGAHYHPELDPANYGFTIWDLDREFICGGLAGCSTATLREILNTLKKTYCENIGVEYMHIQHPDEKAWLQKHLETTDDGHEPLDAETRRQIFQELTTAEGFERFLHTKFIGHKRFSLEGAEAVIPVLGALLSSAADEGVKEAVMGMAHRGRLNILVNILKKPYARIFAEFEGDIDPNSVQGTGDVKYHLGAAGDYKTKDGKSIRVSIVPNPSHLEAVNPVVEGIVRAKQDRMQDLERERVLPVLIHGDAAFAGQGVVAETLNLSQLKGYRTGGTIHIIINNQIGFTTPPEEARSSPYATDVAKMVQAPIIHVNADDPEAAVRMIKLAYAYRQRFKKDVVLDVVCYRRHGHNEGDEPSYTQPVLYKKIQEHPSVGQIYKNRLLRDEVITEEEAEEAEKRTRQCLDDSFEEGKKKKVKFEPDRPLAVPEEEIKKLQPDESTAVSMEWLESVAEALTTFPDGFKVHPKLEPQFKKRKKLLVEENKIDWAFAEALAFGTLLCEGVAVRLCGQDSTRGTFSQRHLILVDLNTGQEYVPLNNIEPEQAQIQACDSLLSEEAALGFEFGYTVADPLTLVIWEAQFGDFGNGAQVMIDNFIVSSEAKWDQPCDLVMLLPHGYEGQGPEHSSSRIERFLTLCAENNIRVCNCTTPAQYFHVLRRQMHDAVRKPLVVMTPKSLLRHPKVISHPNEFTSGGFRELLDDPNVEDRSKVERLVICSGKVYYDLLEYQQENDIHKVAIVRVEQYYPYPKEQIAELLKAYSKAGDVVWVQEEPQNMGAWNYLRYRIQDDLRLNQSLRYVGRPESASTATGSLSVHKDEQRKLVEGAFA